MLNYEVMPNYVKRTVFVHLSRLIFDKENKSSVVNNLITIVCVEIASGMYDLSELPYL